MGNCLACIDVSSKYEVGKAEQQTESQYGPDADRSAALAADPWSTWLSLHISCRNLKNADVLSKSDAMGVLYQWKDSAWVEIARTEMVANNLGEQRAGRLRKAPLEAGLGFTRTGRVDSSGAACQCNGVPKAPPPL
ncbi:hypothetical protein TSOC_001008 [Tetrabaena socialis]|uniref:Uncharacterized protein n=1 Tax=Tetrabaena socialis TaxID=47790 RepID=A0A2J8AHS9_9CHLO|nr:hypothetical protein TSOC_001008 [Tetrabaena socialis]|eukprot:PNH12070.1 hypothetical protein TSOC_001008 [Tetrabaena socialis]